jgi:hypothetical protein
VCNNYFVKYVFVAVELIIEPLPSNDEAKIDKLMGCDLKKAIDMGSSAMIYVPSFTAITSGIQESTGWVHGHTDSKPIP